MWWRRPRVQKNYATLFGGKVSIYTVVSSQKNEVVKAMSATNDFRSRLEWQHSYNSIDGAIAKKRAFVFGAKSKRDKVFRSTPNLGADLHDQLRSDLYAAVPFVAVLGMTTRTRQVVRHLSRSREVPPRPATEGEVFRYSFHEREPLGQQAVTWPLMASSLIACIGQFCFGYNTSATNGPEELIFPGRTATQWAMAVAAFALGGPVGAGFGGAVANRFGRKVAAYIEASAFVFSGLLQCFAPNIQLFTLGRFICGAASGFSSVLVPVYLGEIAAPVLRGAMATVSQMALVGGILAADLVSFGKATLGWRGVFAVSPALAILQLGLAIPFMLESPRWLLDQDNEEADEEAREALRLLHALPDDGAVDHEVSHILSASSLSADKEEGGSVMADPRARPVLMAVVALHLAQQLCGINAVFYYSTMFFDGVSISNPLVATTIVAVVNVIATYAAVILLGEMDLGRKPLLTASAAGMLASCFLLTAALLGMLPDQVALLSVVAYVFFFEIGLGPIPWSLVGEVFDHAHVDSAQSTACQVNWIANFFVGLCFPALASYLGPYTFIPFAVVLAATLAFVILKLPETKHASVEYIQDAMMSSTALLASKQPSATKKIQMMSEKSRMVGSSRDMHSSLLPMAEESKEEDAKMETSPPSAARYVDALTDDDDPLHKETVDA